MNSKEIKETLENSSQLYLDYLSENNLGIERIAVDRIMKKYDDVFLLILSKSFFDCSELEYEIKGNLVFDVIEPLVETSKRRMLYVKVNAEYLKIFEKLEPKDIFVVSDMKFLVERVKKWYRSYGESVVFPENLPTVKANEEYAKALKLSPCQEKAIKTIFSQPFSYIWGAPGTGKTKYVLANSVLNYIKNDENEKIIFVVTPTNVALEQSLFGILPVLKDENFDLAKIIRLGIPSEDFEQKFPEVCEKRILEKLEAEKRKIYEDITGYFMREEEIKKNENSSLCEKYIEINKKIEEKYDEVSLNVIENARKKYDEAKSNMFSYALRNKIRIIGCTVDKFIALKINYSLKQTKTEPAHIFLDEACYCNLAKALTLFSLNCPVTFLGDHKQLPPVCEADEKIYVNEKYKDMCFWSQSAIYAEEAFTKEPEDIFNSYYSGKAPAFEYTAKSDLNETHRFGSGLCEILEKYVYENHLTSYSENETNILTINAKGHGNNRENKEEAKKIYEFITENKLENYMVLTPYKNQEQLIKKFTENVMTVHRSQGREWDTVILSVVDTNNMYFTDSTNRFSKGLELLNTAISRAKNNLVVVCNCDFWVNTENQLIGEIVKYCS